VKIIVLGAGVIGTTTAFFLARAGYDIEVVDRQQAAGLETSFANGGLVAPGMSDPWAAPGIGRLMIAKFGQASAPFAIRFGAFPGLFTWGWQFLQNSARARWRRNTEAVLGLALTSNAVLAQVTRELGLQYDRGERGNLRIYRAESSLAAADADAEIYRKSGGRVVRMDQEACIRLEPSLAPIAGQFCGGLHYAEDCSGDCFKFTQGLAEAAARFGVNFRFSTNILGFAVDGGRVRRVITDQGELAGDAFVLACGSYSEPLARGLGLKLPILPVRGYSVTLPLAGWNDPPSLPIVDYDRKMVVIRLGDRIRLAGTAEFAGFNSTANRSRIELLRQAFGELFPSAPTAGPIEPWHGLRPMCPDGRPIIGPSNTTNLFLNTGHGPLGWTLACGSAQMLTELIAGRRSATDYADFSYERFGKKV
jgi:D-amino-acid dehydrogenase